MKKMLPYLKNKYYIGITIFLVWMLFLDRNDYISQYQHRDKLKTLKKDKAYYQEEITKTQKDLENLSSDQEHLETFAREKYLMKKDNEDIFIIQREKK